MIFLAVNYLGNLSRMENFKCEIVRVQGNLYNLSD